MHKYNDYDNDLKIVKTVSFFIRFVKISCNYDVEYSLHCICLNTFIILSDSIPLSEFNETNAILSISHQLTDMR